MWQEIQRILQDPEQSPERCARQTPPCRCHGAPYICLPGPSERTPTPCSCCSCGTLFECIVSVISHLDQPAQQQFMGAVLPPLLAKWVPPAPLPDAASDPAKFLSLCGLSAPVLLPMEQMRAARREVLLSILCAEGLFCHHQVGSLEPVAAAVDSMIPIVAGLITSVHKLWCPEAFVQVSFIITTSHDAVTIFACVQVNHLTAAVGSMTAPSVALCVAAFRRCQPPQNVPRAQANLSPEGYRMLLGMTRDELRSYYGNMWTESVCPGTNAVFCSVLCFRALPVCLRSAYSAHHYPESRDCTAMPLTLKLLPCCYCCCSPRHS